MNYYNEFDAKTAAVLRELIRAGLIPAGDVDERSICDVRASDLRGYTQCHFFAGIGGWAEALRLAGWPSDRPVWTGSCPCQPFSVAGKGLGTADERHLWPVFAELIRECRPAIAFGEQVASRAGRDWLAGVRADLEGMGYAVGAADLCAAGVGAPHIRQRLYWVANNKRDGCDARRSPASEQKSGDAFVGYRSSTCRLADPPSGGQRIDGGAQRQAGHADQCGTAGGLADPSGEQADQEQRGPAAVEGGRPAELPGRRGALGGMGDVQRAGLEGHDARPFAPGSEAAASGHGGACSAWSDFDILPCRDGKARRVESGSFPLAHGVPARVVRLRGYGNAIVPQVAAAFVTAAMQAMSDVENCVAPA